MHTDHNSNGGRKARTLPNSDIDRVKISDGYENASNALSVLRLVAISLDTVRDELGALENPTQKRIRDTICDIERCVEMAAHNLDKVTTLLDEIEWSGWRARS